MKACARRREDDEAQPLLPASKRRRESPARTSYPRKAQTSRPRYQSGAASQSVPIAHAHDSSRDVIGTSSGSSYDGTGSNEESESAAGSRGHPDNSSDTGSGECDIDDDDTSRGSEGVSADTTHKAAAHDLSAAAAAESAASAIAAAAAAVKSADHAISRMSDFKGVFVSSSCTNSLEKYTARSLVGAVEYSRSYATALEAAAHVDLASLALGGKPHNLPHGFYQEAWVIAVRAYFVKQWPEQLPKRVLQQHASDAAIAAVSKAAAAAAAAAAGKCAAAGRQLQYVGVKGRTGSSTWEGRKHIPSTSHCYTKTYPTDFMAAAHFDLATMAVLGHPSRKQNLPVHYTTDLVAAVAEDIRLEFPGVQLPEYHAETLHPVTTAAAATAATAAVESAVASAVKRLIEDGQQKSLTSACGVRLRAGKWLGWKNFGKVGCFVKTYATRVEAAAHFDLASIAVSGKLPDHHLNFPSSTYTAAEISAFQDYISSRFGVQPREYKIRVDSTTEEAVKAAVAAAAERAQIAHHDNVAAASFCGVRRTAEGRYFGRKIFSRRFGKGSFLRTYATEVEAAVHHDLANLAVCGDLPNLTLNFPASTYTTEEIKIFQECISSKYDVQLPKLGIVVAREPVQQRQCITAAHQIADKSQRSDGKGLSSTERAADRRLCGDEDTDKMSCAMQPSADVSSASQQPAAGQAVTTASSGASHRTSVTADHAGQVRSIMRSASALTTEAAARHDTADNSIAAPGRHQQEQAAETSGVVEQVHEISSTQAGDISDAVKSAHDRPYDCVSSLIVAVSDDKLKSPEIEARLLAATLTDLGHTVTLLLNPSRDQLLAEVDRFKTVQEVSAAEGRTNGNLVMVQGNDSDFQLKQHKPRTITVISHGCQDEYGLKGVQTADGAIVTFIDALEVHAARFKGPLLVNLSMCRSINAVKAFSKAQRAEHMQLSQRPRGWHLAVEATKSGRCAWGDDQPGKLSMWFEAWFKANFLQWHPTFHGAFVSARDCFRKQQEELEGKEAPQIVGDVQMPVFNPDEEGNKDLFPHGYVPGVYASVLQLMDDIKSAATAKKLVKPGVLQQQLMQLQQLLQHKGWGPFVRRWGLLQFTTADGSSKQSTQLYDLMYGRVSRHVHQYFIDFYKEEVQLPGALLWLAAVGDSDVNQAAVSVMTELEPLSHYGRLPWEYIAGKDAEYKAQRVEKCRIKLECLRGKVPFVRAALELPAPAGLA